MSPADHFVVQIWLPNRTKPIQFTITLEECRTSIRDWIATVPETEAVAILQASPAGMPALMAERLGLRALFVRLYMREFAKPGTRAVLFPWEGAASWAVPIGSVEHIAVIDPADLTPAPDREIGFRFGPAGATGPAG